MARQLGWWGLGFLLYGVLLTYFAAMWLTQNLEANLPQARPKTKRTKSPNPANSTRLPTLSGSS
jgi:hypothetical protein